MERERHIYHYEGPVVDQSGKVVAESVGNKHQSGTRAVSEKQARSNILFNWKRNNGHVGSSKYSLPGEIIFVE